MRPSKFAWHTLLYCNLDLFKSPRYTLYSKYTANMCITLNQIRCQSTQILDWFSWCTFSNLDQANLHQENPKDISITKKVQIWKYFWGHHSKKALLHDSPYIFHWYITWYVSSLIFLLMQVKGKDKISPVKSIYAFDTFSHYLQLKY